MQKIAPCLWFNFNAEEAVNHYVGVFRHSRILHTSYYGKELPDLAGKALMIEFELEGQRFQALNGGPQFPFTQAISLSVDCADQAEVDSLWQALCDGGAGLQCGWLKDKYGLSWQIVPRRFVELMLAPDKAAVARMMQAMFTMTRLEVAKLETAFRGE
jgi:predicted 3-demethylubiquinone-9 3-methyltransferase (glyoxalase superfamily)